MKGQSALEIYTRTKYPSPQGRNKKVKFLDTRRTAKNQAKMREAKRRKFAKAFS